MSLGGEGGKDEDRVLSIVLVRLPCYDLTPIISPTLGLREGNTSGIGDFHGLTGGVYKTRERIHGSIADLPLLAIPTSCRRVSACNLNWDRL